MLTLKVTQKGIRNAEGRLIPVGDVLTLDAHEIPASYLNKAVLVVGEKPPALVKQASEPVVATPPPPPAAADVIAAAVAKTKTKG